MSTSQSVRRSTRVSLSSKVHVAPSPKRRKLSVSVSCERSSSEAEVLSTHVPSPSKHETPTPRRVVRKTNQQKTNGEPNPADYIRVVNDWKFGAHVSTAGGVQNAILNAAEIGANAFALFLKSQRKWSSPDLSEESISLFKSRMKAFGYDPYHVIPHGSYLINLGNPDPEKRQKSFDCFLDDLRRCELLGLKLYNFHPGSTVGLATKEESIMHIAECLNKAHKKTKSIVTVIENMAGAGNIIGSKFAELAAIIEHVEEKERVGVCFDTCHTFAAGYDLRTREGYEATIAEFDSVVGLRYLRAMHLNDSKTTLGSNRDRHENIGLGHLTMDAFAFIARDSRLRHIPIVLETPLSSVSDPKGDSPLVWRIEIGLLNQFSGVHENIPECVALTSVIEEAVGRKAVLNGGGVQEVRKKSGKKNSVKGKKRAKSDVAKVEEPSILEN